MLRQGSAGITVGVWLLAGSLMGSVFGCTGELEGPPQGSSCATCPQLASPTTRFPRLSHAQWTETVEDLLVIEDATALSARFPTDASRGYFDNDGAELRVDGTLWGDYQHAAEAAAELATSTSERANALVPAGFSASPAADRARLFVEHFLPRAHRRPLSTDSALRYQSLYLAGASLYPDLDADRAGMRVVIEAALQSPFFLYRPELTAMPDSTGQAPLDAWELASRLSFALWQTMPDEALFAAARDGSLVRDEVLTREVDRMLRDPRALETLERFHLQLTGADGYQSGIAPAEMIDPTLPRAMREEVRLFTSEVVRSDLGVRALFSADFTYADAQLARLYEIDGVTGNELVRVSLAGTERRGLLTMAGFLARQATATESDPIHRGAFVNRRFLCADLPPPPALVPAVPASPPGMPRTQRERIDAHTGAGTCGEGCHTTMINPIGFALEHFDELGRFRMTEDNGLPIDAASAYRFGRSERSFNGGVELSEEIAEQGMTHRCYARNLLRFVHTHPVGEEDGPLLTTLTLSSLQGDASIRTLVRTLVLSPSFRHRSLTELDALAATEEN